MKKLSFLFLLSVFALWSCDDDDNDVLEQDDVVVSFEGRLSEAESEFKTTEGVEENGYRKTAFRDAKGLLEFSHYYSNDWGFGGGFTYTNKTDRTTPGFSNISAITGKGKAGKVYLTANANSYTPAQVTNLQPDEYEFEGAWITNTTYAYLAVKDGNAGSGIPVKKFQAGDWFKVTAVGYKADDSELGRVDFYLADFRDGKAKIVDTWEWFDWSPIEEAAYIRFELSSTDNGEWGMNTPSYFCLDGITLED